MTDAVIPTESSGESLDAEAFIADLQDLAHRMKQIQPAGDAGQEMAPAERGILDLLETRGPQTVPQLARLRGTSRQNVQVIVNRLKAEGLGCTTPNTAHKRSVLISITPKGEAMLRSAPDPQKEIADLLVGRVSAEDFMAARRLVSGFREALKVLREERIRIPGRRWGAPQRSARKVPVAAPAPEPVEDENELPVNLL